MGIMRTGRSYSTPSKARKALDDFIKRYHLSGRLDIRFSDDGGMIRHTSATDEGGGCTQSWSARWLISTIEKDGLRTGDILWDQTVSYVPTVFVCGDGWDAGNMQRWSEKFSVQGYPDNSKAIHDTLEQLDSLDDERSRVWDCFTQSGITVIW